MSYIEWYIDKFNFNNNNLILYYNIKRIELGVYDKIDKVILKKFVVNTKEMNKLLDNINVKLRLISDWSEIEK